MFLDGPKGRMRAVMFKIVYFSSAKKLPDTVETEAITLWRTLQLPGKAGTRNTEQDGY